MVISQIVLNSCLRNLVILQTDSKHLKTSGNWLGDPNWQSRPHPADLLINNTKLIIYLLKDILLIELCLVDQLVEIGHSRYQVHLF